MNVERPDDDLAVRNDPLARQLRALLSVDPSPEFVARVRAGIADDANGGIWKGWLAAAGPAVLGTALVLLLGIVMLKQEAPVTPPQDRSRDVQRDRAAASTPRVEPGTPAPMPPAAGAERQPARSRGSRAAQRPTAVMFSTDEMRTLQKFLDGIRTRRVELSPVVVAEPPEATASAIDDIAVAAIEIKPIEIPSLQESTQ